MRIDVTIHNGFNHAECARDRAERNAYAHTDLQLFTDEELECERKWIAEVTNAGNDAERCSHDIINAARAAYIDDVNAGRYVEVYIYIFNRDDQGDACEMRCEVVVYRSVGEANICAHVLDPSF